MDRNASEADLLVEVREDRIDWDRKQKRKRRTTTQEMAHVGDDDPLTHLERSRGKGKKHARKKKRAYVYDESRGEVVVKRRRRPHRDGDYLRDMDLVEY